MGNALPTPATGKKLTVSFGLVNVGVRYAPIVREQRTKGKYVDPETLGPVKQQYVRESDGAVVQPVSAYEHPKGPVVLRDRDALKSERDGRLELRALCELDAIDPLYFEQTYLVWPEKGQESGYDLICEALAQTGKVLVGTSVLTKSTKAVVLRYAQGCLMAHVCTYDANVKWSDHRLVTEAAGERPKTDPAMLTTAISLFDALPSEFDFAGIEDEYDVRLREAIEATASGKPVPKQEEAATPHVADLMEALKASLSATKAEPKEKAKPKRRTAKKTAA